MPELDLWRADPTMRWWTEFAAGASLAPEADALLSRVGEQVGSHRLQDAAERAGRITPELAAWSRTGERIDEVRFDASWYECLDAATASGVCGLPWLRPADGYVVRAAAAELWGRLDIGVMCPVTMTAAAVPVLATSAEPWARGLLEGILAAAAAGIEGRTGEQLAGRGGRHPLVGMAMTEPQGGSDLGGSTTLATDAGDGTWLLNGHKWFCSHPVADGLLVLAREPGLGDGSRGLSCFLVPGWMPGGGQRNGVRIQRLKDKLGTRSLASGEVLLDDAVGVRIGDPGRGVATIIQMVVHTRMDCSLGNAGVLARAVGDAVQHARGRAAFGGLLIDQPLMRMVLADLVLEREASIALAMEVARGFQQVDPLGRLVTAVAKYWITRRAVLGVIECVEALGGNGYTEEFPMARLYRDVQVNSTWEGSGNVMALDVLRALAKQPELATRLYGRVAALVDGAPDDLASEVLDAAAALPAPGAQRDARRFTGRAACLMQAALLVHRAGVTGDEADALVARSFLDTRVTPTHERVWGDAGESLERAAEVLLGRAPGGA